MRKTNQTMRAHELRELLDQVPDTHELVLRRQAGPRPVHSAWSDAHDEAVDAYRAWRITGGAGAYAVYRAAQDREDAAQDALTR